MLKCNALDLSSFFDGELKDQHRAALLEHLGQCQSCARTLAAYGQISSRLRSLPASKEPVPLRSEVLRRLDEVDQRVRPLAGLGGFVRGLALISTTAVVAVCVSLLLGNHDLGGALYLPTNVATSAAPSVRSSDQQPAPAAKVSTTSNASLLAEGSEPSRQDKATSPTVVVTPSAAKATPEGTSGTPELVEPNMDQLNTLAGAEPSAGLGHLAGTTDMLKSVSPQGGQKGGLLSDGERVVESNRPPEKVSPSDSDRRVTRASVGDEPAHSPATGLGLASGNPTTGESATGGEQPDSKRASIEVAQHGAAGEGESDAAANSATLRCDDAVPRVEQFRLVSNGSIHQRLGCSIGTSQRLTMTERVLDHSYLFARADRDGTYVLADSPALWTYYPSRRLEQAMDALTGFEHARETGKPVDASSTAAGGGAIRNYLGEIAEFQHGTVLRSERRVVYVLFSNGTWQDFPDQSKVSMP